jgi:hypothetical protein
LNFFVWKYIIIYIESSLKVSLEDNWFDIDWAQQCDERVWSQ